MIKKMFVLGISFLFLSSLHAQYQFFKIEKGIKTPLKGGDVTIAFDDNMKPTNNLMIEFNVDEYKKKYSYTLFAIELYKKGDDKIALLVNSLAFGNDYYTSKFGSDKVLHYYLFQDEESAKDPKAMFFYTGQHAFDSFTFDNTKDVVSFRMYGCYKTGTEKYYDERSESVKTRDLYSNHEYYDVAGIPTIHYTTTEKAKQVNSVNLEKEKYDRTIGDPGGNEIYSQNDQTFMTIVGINRALENEKNNINKNYTIGNSSVVQFAQIAKAIEEVAAYQTNLIQSETDQTKALEMMETWSKDYEKLMVTDKLTPEKRKQLNKQLKEAETPAAKLAIFLAFQ